MKSIELNKLLIEKFPDLAERYQEEVEWQEGDETGSHVVYGDVFTPYIVKCMENRRDEKLKDIFEFIEFVLVQQDEYASEVIAFSVIESIEYLLLDNERYQDMLGSETKKCLQNLTY